MPTSVEIVKIRRSVLLAISKGYRFSFPIFEQMNRPKYHIIEAYD